MFLIRCRDFGHSSKYHKLLNTKLWLNGNESYAPLIINPPIKLELKKKGWNWFFLPINKN